MSPIFVCCFQSHFFASRKCGSRSLHRAPDLNVEMKVEDIFSKALGEALSLYMNLRYFAARMEEGDMTSQN